MDIDKLHSAEDIKLNIDLQKPLCRCCLSPERKMFDAVLLNAYFVDLTGLNVSDSDGMPNWICWECAALLKHAVRFKQKVLKANSILFEYLTRCAPFPLDAQDPELAKFASSHLTQSNILAFDYTGKGRVKCFEVLQHDKRVTNTELDVFDMPIYNGKMECDIKEENGFSDYEDNITIDAFRTNDVKMTEEELNNLLLGKVKEIDTDRYVKKKKRKSGKKEKDKAKKKKCKKTSESDEPEVKKQSVRRQIELDPNKIRIITLNPEEQVKQRQEESKNNVKYPYMCNLCFKGFNFEAKLQNHMFKHSPSRGPFECKFCHMYLPTSYSYNVHSLIHTRRYECVKCSRRMIDRGSIIDHYRTQHEGTTTMYTCHFCGKVSTNNKTHRSHLRNHHSGERPKCDQCGKTFLNADSLTEHQMIHQGIKNYECTVCKSKFRTRTQLKHHQLKHGSARDYYCVECDTRFKSPHSLRQHLLKSLKHKDVESFKYICTTCHKRFDTEQRLWSHTRVQHEGVKSHACSECGATLASKSSLAKHLSCVHMGRRPPLKHVCHTCGKAFTLKSVLINHIRTHTGEKPFACVICQRAFSQRTAMRTHYKLVHLNMRRSAKLNIKADPMPTPVVEPKQEVTGQLEWSVQPIQACEDFYQRTA